MVDCALRISNDPSGAIRQRIFLMSASSKFRRLSPFKAISPSLIKMISFMEPLSLISLFSRLLCHLVVSFWLAFFIFIYISDVD